MNNKYIMFIIIFSVAGCQSNGTHGTDNMDSDNGPREAIIDRYPGGSKKTVAVYQGKGTEEQLLRRITYAKNGVRVTVEHVESGVIERYEDLYQDCSNADYIRSFLKDSVWMRSDGKGDTKVIEMYLFDSGKGLQAVETNEFETCDSYNISYTGRRTFAAPSNDSETDTFEVKISGPNKIFLGDISKDRSPLERVDRNNIRSDFLISCLNDFYTE
jgi:hypothetical protein